MAVILEKSSEEDMRQLILPLLFHSLESNMSQIQVNIDKVINLNEDLYYTDVVMKSKQSLNL